MEIKKSEELPVLELKGGGKLPDNYTGIIKWPNGRKDWYLNGLLHREDGPACEFADGSKEWYLNGKRHREDGPACEFANGTKYWFLNGKCYSKAEWKIAVEKLKKEKEGSNKPDPQVLELNVGEIRPSNYTGIAKYPDGAKHWYLNGERHREDGPAIERADGSKYWYLNSELHREDGPVIEYPDGTKVWYLNGNHYSEAEWKIAVEKLKKEKEEANKPDPQVLELKGGEKIPDNYTGIIKWFDGSKFWYLNGKPHREDGPACEWVSGTKYWCLNGELHREDGPAAEWADGSKFWHLNGKYHREDGPAIEWPNGSKHWYLNGNLHREDGPAVERANGSKAWYLNGNHYSEAEWKIAVEKLNKEKEEANKPELPVLELKPEQNIPYNYTGIIKWSDGDIWRLLNGKFHREDGPAIEKANGTKVWYLNGKRHREDGPAIERADGLNYWYLNGKECASESELKIAVEKLKKLELQMLELKAGEQVPNNYTGIIKWNDSDKWWYLNGKFHREDGPAIEWADGRKEWWLNGEKCSEETWNKLVNNSVKQQPESKKEEKTQMSRFKSDMRQAGIRIACRQSVSVVRDTLVSILSAGKTKSEAKRIRDGISSLFDTEVGRGMIGYLMGSMLPMVKEHFPEKYQSITEELANEFRIEGMSVVGGEAFKFVLPFLGMAKEGMVSAMSSLVADDSPPTRVDLPTAAPKVLDDADDMPSVENQKELKRSK